MKGLLAVVLDFDGVILRSVGVKTRAFEALFADETAEARRRIVEHHLENGGISRFEKFRWAYREVLRRPLPPEDEERLGERFNALVEDAVAAAEWVPGAEEFLACARGKIPLFVAWGTPEDEVRRIVERRGMQQAFVRVHGSPTKKADILRNISRAIGADPASLLMVGDARNDWEAARDAGTRFLGIVEGPLTPFPSDAKILPNLRGLAAEVGI